MKTFTAIITLFASAAFAAPATLAPRGGVCPDGLLYTNPQCCATDVLGVADLNCENPSRQPYDGADLAAICAADGMRARCCSIPVAGQAVLCNDVVGA
ncbi:fungal hydrophobin domain-containing protein [Pochonia chlamydosporia 170]|uniref:Fungal hydrophobin domain-containing protein n=1 Tax=Pochonia chlamydosporia 170 TaxID=1380566 RepID=A0A179FTD4_METCM|nr:fungal hydrophobin domain-containing protein [Pochonia chlamydosporia 170]OAQ68627.1 fungal hydrophobin domain-containing protein [Pochonia chlamydosporia 170]